jgi:O-antigen/teichoic acid export membrane protein
MQPSPPGPEAGGERPSLGILKQFAYLLSARWLREACQAVFLIYLARLSAATYGEFMLALGLGSILLLFSEFGLNLPLVSLLSRPDARPGESLAQVTALKSLLLFLAWLGVLGFVHWQAYAPALKSLMLLLGLGVGLEALANTFFVALQVQGRQDLQGQVKAVAAALGFGYGLTALFLGAPPLAVAAFKLIETLVNLAGAVFLVRRQPEFHLSWPKISNLAQTLRLGIIFALMEVAAIIYNKANLFFLQRYAGADGVAQYSVTWSLVEGLAVIVSNLLLQSILYPLFVRLWETDRPRVPGLAQNTARWLLLAAALVMYALFIESDRLIPLIYGPHYQEAIWLQRLLVLTVVIAFLHNLATFLLLSMRLERLVLACYLAGLAFNLLWCSLALPYKPLLGAALAMVLTKGLVAAFTVTACQRRVPLFRAGSLTQLTLALTAGALIYGLGIGVLPRLAAEVLALTPLLWLAWRWWR